MASMISLIEWAGFSGGMAYVQAYLDDNPVTQGLAKLQGKIKSWQAGLSRMAAGTMGGELPEPLAAIARFATSLAPGFHSAARRSCSSSQRSNRA
jgi:hypothetical protein